MAKVTGIGGVFFKSRGDRAALAEVDVLLVRSVTEVSRAALAGSPVRFVGTCTIGTDHLDLDYFAGLVNSSVMAFLEDARGVAGAIDQLPGDSDDLVWEHTE